MSTITGEITRINGGKDCIISSTNTKLRAQGSSEIPAGTKIDEIYPYIDSIQQGGGTENAFMQMTDLSGVFSFKQFDDQTAYKEGLTRYAQNAITNLRYVFYNSQDSNLNNSNILDKIGLVANKATVINFDYAFSNFSNYNNSSYNKILDLNNLRVSGGASYGFSGCGSNYGTLVIVLNSESFKNAIDVQRLFYNTRNSIKFKFNENKIYLNNATQLSYAFANMSRQNVFIDNNNDPITDIDIYLYEGSVSISNMFLNNQSFQRVNLHNNYYMTDANGLFQNMTYLKSVTGLNLSRISLTNSIFGSTNYLTDFGELGIINGSAVGSANNTNLVISKIWNASADTIRDGQTIGYWYEKFANALGNKTATGTVTITINTTLYNSLTATQIALITDKGYTLAYAS